MHNPTYQLALATAPALLALILVLWFLRKQRSIANAATNLKTAPAKPVATNRSRSEIIEDKPPACKADTSKVEELKLIKVVSSTETKPPQSKPARKVNAKGSSEGDLKRDQRRHRRAIYAAFELVAPYLDGQFPSSEMFQRVRCRDVSQSGISFFSAIPIATKQVIVVLRSNDDDERKYIVSDVVQSRAISINGKTMYIIGCRFICRIEPSSGLHYAYSHH